MQVIVKHELCSVFRALTGGCFDQYVSQRRYCTLKVCNIASQAREQSARGTPDQAFRALTTNEVEKWWTIPGVYHLKDWKADLRVQGRWSVTVELNDGKQVHEWGEFSELDVPNQLVMTRRFGGHPLLGERETTLTYRLQPSPHGTLVTVREEGFIGRSEAAYGNAENWEKVVTWLDRYLGSK
jgi:uncharacterized protein YndB with AHSA1/START domain